MTGLKPKLLMFLAEEKGNEMSCCHIVLITWYARFRMANLLLSAERIALRGEIAILLLQKEMPCWN
jgi:hypothetical protein